VINAHFPGMVVASPRTRTARRPGMRMFWALFAAEGVLIGVLLLAMLSALPSLMPMSRAADIDTLRAAVWSRVDGSLDDAVVEVAPGVMARSSSVRGFSLGDNTYYYYFEGKRGFDPLSRGKVSESQVEVVARDSDGERTLVIYRILSS
jgi:hypothetical protein